MGRWRCGSARKATPGTILRRRQGGYAYVPSSAPRCVSPLLMSAPPSLAAHRGPGGDSPRRRLRTAGRSREAPLARRPTAGGRRSRVSAGRGQIGCQRRSKTDWFSPCQSLEFGAPLTLAELSDPPASTRFRDDAAFLRPLRPFDDLPDLRLGAGSDVLAEARAASLPTPLAQGSAEAPRRKSRVS